MPETPEPAPASRERGGSTAAALLSLWRWTGARRRWASLIPLSLAVTACELTGLALVFALIHLLDAGQLPAQLPVSGALVAMLGAPEGGAQLAVGLALLVAVIYIIKNAAKLLEVLQRERLAARASVDLSHRLFGHYLASPYTFHLRTHSGDLIRNVRESVDRACYTGLLSATALVSELVVAGAVIVFVLLRAPAAALAAAVSVVAVTALVLHLLHRVQTRTGRESLRLHGDLLRLLQDSLSGVREVKVFRREGYFAESYRKLRVGLGQVGVRHGVLNWLPRVTVETAFICGLAALVLVSTRAQGSDVRLLPLVGLFAFAGLRLLPSLTTATYHLGQLRFSRAHIDQLLSELEQAVPLDPEVPVDRLPFEHEIALEDVGYTYPDEGTPALAGIDLRVARGESIGIVGPTGAGKSTLVGLVIGLLHPSVGRLTVDGRVLSDNVRGWQALVGFVPQSVFMLDASVRENIAFGVEPARIDEARLREAIQIAQLGDFVQGLSQGLDTRVGERGVRLSGGERQRLAVARALYSDPQVLIFDEATASLDNRTELALTQAIEWLHGKKTMFIIAHRLTTVRRCDRLVFLADGHVKAIGTFDELLEREADFERVVYPGGRP